MTFKLEKASDWDFKRLIEITSLKDLQKIQEQYGYELIINFSKETIKIYDAYIE